MKSVLIFPNDARDRDNSVAERIISDLVSAGHRVYAAAVNKRTLGQIEGLTYELEPRALQDADIGIVLGGDGSILKAAGVCAPFGVDILGINLGQLGFMAGLESTELSRITQIVESDYVTESRMMLEISIERDGELIFSGGPVLNDVVLAKSRGYGVIESALTCDGVLLNTYRGDGLIIATPTGSTAYSLSAGGPIVDPSLDCICATPICAHSLKSRPLVFKDSSVVEISCNSNGNSACVTLDGAIAFDIDDGDVIRIVRSECRANLIKTDNMDFFSNLNKKIADK